MYRLSDSVSALAQVGPRQKDNFNRIGINTIADLLYHFPKYYRDTSNIVMLSELNREQRQTVKVKLLDLKNIRIRGGKSIQKGTITDDSGEIKVTWFNQPFILNALPINSEILLSGKLSSKSIKPELLGPEYEVVKINNINLGKIIPIYPLTEGITIKWLRARFDQLIRSINNIEDLNETLPKNILNEYQLLDLKSALTQIHSPQTQESLILARKRLAFDELLDIYLKLIKEKQERLNSAAAKIKIKQTQIDDFINTLPFKLTMSQVSAVQDIFTDYCKNYPTNRLIQGDVGSGKTIVALLSTLPVISSGYQVVVLAPTTVLANQHYETFKKLIGKDHRIQLLTQATVKNKDINLDSQIIIATHSILYHQKVLNNLGLLIIDEQHRFGVQQRQQLLELKTQNITPHLLNLTATPIPRSIALTLFGEIDVSVIEKPTQRKTTKSFLVPSNKRKDSLLWIKDKLINGSQVFWICPLIENQIEEDVETASLKAVKKMAQDITNQFPKRNIGLMHGKLSNEEKNKVIERFRNKEIDILVSTTVIEVGIDIPGADIIVIEDAERFGLAQLHQLRGRVGRNNQDSWCLLFTNLEDNEKIRNRLTYFTKESNGIKIAEFDLRNRGPGEVYGTMQSGIPNLKIANFGNSDFLMTVREAALKILS